ncbi:MAG TPA: sulfite exporter TauE/SafE family protein [bacterium]|nr:sulfite exporter TauE/SafE family protein [bacterium]
MNEYLALFALFAIGSVAGFLNVMAGGGSTLTLPALIFLGLDSALANGTNRVAIFIQNIFAIISFQQEKFAQFKISLKMALVTLPGAIVGALAAIHISDQWFQKILAMIMIGIIITLVIPKSQKKFVAEGKNYNPWLVYPALVGIGFYGGFVQAGVGFLIMATLHHLMRFNLIHVNMHKVFIIALFTVPALIVFWCTGNVDWVYGLILAAGNSLGGWWAAKVSVKKGENIIRVVLLVAILIMALKLLKVF